MSFTAAVCSATTSGRHPAAGIGKVFHCAYCICAVIMAAQRVADEHQKTPAGPDLAKNRGETAKIRQKSGVSLTLKKMCD